jgi:hypothetical protein
MVGTLGATNAESGHEALRANHTVGLNSKAVNHHLPGGRRSPLCLDSDQIPQRSEITRCARSGHRKSQFGELRDCQPHLLMVPDSQEGAQSFADKSAGVALAWAPKGRD